MKDVDLQVLGGVRIKMNALSGYAENWEHTCTLSPISTFGHLLLES